MQLAGKKIKGAAADAAIYSFAFALAALPFSWIDDLTAATCAFTATATFVVFLFSCALSDVSVYDPYWSVAPPVMLIAAMIKYRLFTVNAFLLLALVGVWFITYRGIGHEDWRYAQYRERCSGPLFLLISFFGLHYIPTAVVWAGSVCAFLSMGEERFSPLCLFGAAVMLAAVALEFFADAAVHRFLHEHKGEAKTCDISVWKYSRHPNYLGEMTFWTGLYVYFVCLRPDLWYCGLGFLSIIVLFFTVSIPMMEKHNAMRRADYPAYKKKTSMILLLPNKKNRDS